MQYRYALAQHGTTLATRPFAKRLRAEVVKESEGRELVELDFSGILSASHSFADEFVAQLAEDSQNGIVHFGVAVSGAAPNVESRLSKALELRDVRLVELA
jgi:STAS-like domain of unknown function (DUF4325)